MALNPVEVGSEAPQFELYSSEIGDNGKPGRKIALSDYRGTHNVVLAFYPLDFSPVCTGEAICFEETIGRFRHFDTQVLGLSVDSAWTHAAFKEKLRLSYPLLADFHPKGAVSKRYGLYLEETGICARATVVIGKDQRVKWVKVQQIPDPRDNKRILEVLQSLQEHGEVRRP